MGVTISHLSSLINDANCFSGCAKCAELEEQLKLISEENTRLKEGIRWPVTVVIWV